MTKEQSLLEVIQNSQLKLAKAPEGTLVARTAHGCTRYYCRKEDDKSETYIGQNEKGLIKDLQEKGYYEKLKAVAEEELATIRKIHKLEGKLKHFEQVYFNLPENKRNMIEPYVSSEMEEVERKIADECKYWAREKLTRRGVSKELNLVTLNGERVRSKSELIIADRLKNAGVPYYYEGKYVFSDDDLNRKKSMHDRDYDVWFPDFQVLNVRTGERLFWEHFGMMDNPQYCESCQFKLETYAKHGIFMGKNLIVTMESSLHTLNVAYIDKLIEEFLK